MVLLADGMIDLRLGRWQEVLTDVETCDSIVCDPPYSARTHEGHDDAVRVATWRRGNGAAWEATWAASGGRRRKIDYGLWTAADVDEFCAAWAQRCRGWTVTFNSHDLLPAISAGFERRGRYSFAPLPFFSPGSRVRLSGDGPSSWTTWINVTRPTTREFQRWGTLPGGYVYPPEDMLVVGGKPLSLMRAIVRDYTKPGDLVVDPFCGGGTTALACAIEGRCCITSEMDPATFELARKRLERGFTRDMLVPQRPERVRAKQGDLLDGGET